MSDDDLEKNTFGRRLVRYGKASGTMAGLASRVIGERYLGFKIERTEHADQLMLALGNLKGPLMKVGQILATIPEALPPEYADAFAQLQSNAPPMGWLFVKRRMKAELGPDWQSKFKSFEREAAAAASLGQVHIAESHEGQKLACKLQYPDMRSAIDADLNQLGIIFKIYGQYDKSIQTGNIQQELSARLYEELDYERESKNCALYASMLQNENGVHVPEVVHALSTDRLLTTNWLEGKRSSPSKPRRRRYATKSR